MTDLIEKLKAELDRAEEEFGRERKKLEAERNDKSDECIKLRDELRNERRKNKPKLPIPELPQKVKEYKLIMEGQAYRCEKCLQAVLFSEDELKARRRGGVEEFTTNATPKQRPIAELGSRDYTQE